ncbi:hypothetical protein N7524_007144 [Penicillium chrysogenum]|nr:hypothetical protein N7524_007144 [Penicillium chrysogenum]
MASGQLIETGGTTGRGNPRLYTFGCTWQTHTECGFLKGFRNCASHLPVGGTKEPRHAIKSDACDEEIRLS